MILTIDNGNTHTVFGLFQNKKLLSTFKIKNRTYGTAAEYWTSFSHSCKKSGVETEEIGGVIISSVVPMLTKIMTKMSLKYLKTRPTVVSDKLQLGIKIEYENPAQLGADRICNVIGAYELFGGPAIVIDFGTAITYDIISKKGNYLGGLIAPGISTSALGLYYNTAILPKIKTQFPKNIIGKDTISSMQSGVMFGTLKSMEGIVVELKKAAGSNSKVIGTGGDIKIFSKNSKMIDVVEPYLVLKGALIIYERNQ